MKLKFESVWIFVVSVVISERVVDAAETLAGVDRVIALQNYTEPVFPLVFRAGPRAKAPRRNGRLPQRAQNRNEKSQNLNVNAPYPTGHRIALTCDGAVSDFVFDWPDLNSEMIHLFIFSIGMLWRNSDWSTTAKNDGTL